jgi:hypothetical protein
MALGENFVALSEKGVKSLLFAMNVSCRSLGVLNGGGWVVFIATNHFLVVASFLPCADGPRSWSGQSVLLVRTFRACKINA